MQSHPTRLMILVAGPYRSGTGDDPAKLAANVAAMEAFAMPLFRAGHLPVVGEWLGLPLATLAGSVRIGDAAFEEVFHPIAERLLERCDALLRVGGPSEGADRLVAVAGSGSGGLSRSTGGARVRNHRGLNRARPNQRLKLSARGLSAIR